MPSHTPEEIAKNQGQGVQISQEDLNPENVATLIDATKSGLEHIKAIADLAGPELGAQFQSVVDQYETAIGSLQNPESAPEAPGDQSPGAEVNPNAVGGRPVSIAG